MRGGRRRRRPGVKRLKNGKGDDHDGKHPGVMAAAVAWALWGAAACLAQTAPAADAQSPPAVGPAPCSVEPQPEPCGSKPAAAARPSAAEKFPFPGEPAAGTTPANLSGVPDAPDTSGTPSAPVSKQDANKAFPFPGEAKPGSDANQPGTSSSSSSDSGDDATPTDAGATPRAEPRDWMTRAARAARPLPADTCCTG